jgi:hypothetical protein
MEQLPALRAVGQTAYAELSHTPTMDKATLSSYMEGVMVSLGFVQQALSRRQKVRFRSISEFPGAPGLCS